MIKKRDFTEASMNKHSILKAFLILVILGLVFNVKAGVISCTSTLTLAKVDYASACEKSLTATQDFLNTTPITVNQEAFFGYTDWSFLKKDDPAGNGQTGIWSLTNNEWAQYSDIMLIFKDGAGTTLLGFTLTPSSTSGNWNSPFTAYEFTNLCMHHDAHGNQAAYDDCSKIKDVSHLSYYARGALTRVSEPASLVLMVLGLLSLRLVRRQAY
jgi:hypothetical protein